ncbi:hypothetical protein [Sporosarcina sp. D27]|uniref:hypothetical protein n=1 Tax=Sporosarcina sp. D27 TaxID=1382305 RepID=UPI00047056F1|nr:hypothetical protein [Sporosarcina sp. D27]
MYSSSGFNTKFKKEEKKIIGLIVLLFLLLLISLNIGSFLLLKRGNLSLVIILGIIMMMVFDVLGIKGGELFLRFGGGEGGGYLAAMCAAFTFVNGFLLVTTVIIMFIIRVIRNKKRISS